MTVRREDLFFIVDQELRNTLFIDIHTHLYASSFGDLGLSGIDELLTYHYLETELFRSSAIKPEQYWRLSKTEQADVIWRTLFVESAPVSEATRGVIAILDAFGLRTDATDLIEARRFFKGRDLNAHIDDVFKLAGISEVVMTNDPSPPEAKYWLSGVQPDPRFHPSLRLDNILSQCPDVAGVQLYLDQWCRKMKPLYLALSLPETFQFPDESRPANYLKSAVLPACREFNLPLALMIGVRRGVNPRLRLGGDGTGRADLRWLERICGDYPDNRFLVTVLSRENQHELCVYARKFANLMPFGCWWFLNNPSVVEEITRERLEMLGTSFIPQHSDARVLEQLIYKWRNTRRTMAPILANAYQLLFDDGRVPTRAEIQRDIKRLFRSNFEQWMP
jgi:hypothetical protein